MIDAITADVIITILIVTLIVLSISSVGIVMWYRYQIRRDKERVSRIISKLKKEVNQ